MADRCSDIGGWNNKHFGKVVEEMSIHTDERQFGTDEERAEWQQELKSEYRREQWEDEHPEEVWGNGGKGCEY